jgi:hypothetical protein
MGEEALAWNFVCGMHTSGALHIWLFWLWFTVVIVSDRDVAWWLSTMLALARIEGPLLGVLFTFATSGWVACLDS